MQAPILVTGGTGTLGRLVVPRLRRDGHAVRVMSRRPHQDDDGVEYVVGNLADGNGIDRAVEDVETIVHLAGTSKGDDQKARHLVSAASRAGVRHLVFISVVGADRIPITSAVDRAMFGYFAAKHAAERIIADSGVPWTTVRATQFHDLLFKTVTASARMPVAMVPSGFRFQPVDAADVADRLVELAHSEPLGLVSHDLAGPTVYDLDTLVRSYLRARKKHRMIMHVRVPGKAARAFRQGANLSADGVAGQRTWEQFLASNLSTPEMVPDAA